MDPDKLLPGQNWVKPNEQDMKEVSWLGETNLCKEISLPNLAKPHSMTKADFNTFISHMMATLELEGNIEKKGYSPTSGQHLVDTMSALYVKQQAEIEASKIKAADYLSQEDIDALLDDAESYYDLSIPSTDLIGTKVVDLAPKSKFYDDPIISKKTGKYSGVRGVFPPSQGIEYKKTSDSVERLKRTIFGDISK